MTDIIEPIMRRYVECHAMSVHILKWKPCDVYWRLVSAALAVERNSDISFERNQALPFIAHLRQESE